ncbi:MAG: hypothetical protein ACE5D6_09755, partial [Candidatus Zixiibacteriota bacterium]
MKFYYKFMILFVGVGIILLLLSINCSKRSANIVLPNLIIETTSPMEYTAPYGGPSPLSVFVKVKSSTDDEIPYSFRTDAVWMTLANSQHMDTTITPDSFIVLFDVAKPGKFLDVGTYIDSITFKSENAENSPQYLEFIMNIGSEMIISPPGLSYVAALDGDNPPPQRFYIRYKSKSLVIS